MATSSAPAVRDRVMEYTDTIGTGTLSLDGAVQGYQTWSSGYNGLDTNNVAYVIEDGTRWEVGTGNYDASDNTLTREHVLASSNGGLLVNFPGVIAPAATKVFSALSAEALAAISAPLDKVLAVVDDVDLTVLTPQVLYTAPTDYAPVVTRVMLEVTEAIGVSSYPILAVTSNGVSLFGDVTPELDDEGQSFTLGGTGRVNKATEADSVVLQVGTIAGATSLKVRAYLVGRLRYVEPPPPVAATMLMPMQTDFSETAGSRTTTVNNGAFIDDLPGSGTTTYAHGGRFNVSGADSNVAIDAFVPDHNSDFTYEGFCYLEDASGSAMLGWSGGEGLICVESGAFDILFYSTDNQARFFGASAAVSINQRHHWMVTRNGDKIRCGIDGMVLAEMDVSGLTLKTPFNFYVGSAGGFYSFAGVLAGLAFTPQCKYTGSTSYTPPTSL